MNYHVKTKTYSGPFDLLLSLVNRQKIDIGAISITEVANQYLTEVESMQAMDLDVASDFVLVAAMLLDIKSASLVPDDSALEQQGLDENDRDIYANLSAEDAREVLIARLIAYKQFRNVSAALGARMESENHMYPCIVGVDPEFLHAGPNYLKGVALPDLAAICANLEARRSRVLLHAEHIAPKRAPLVLTIESVDRVVRSCQRTTFSKLLSKSITPVEVVATFLAVLELVRSGSITVRQSKTFDEIVIEHVEGAPRYRKDVFEEKEAW